ncbi:MAG TPA: CPBP family intramembrane glutamic endopeptidase [Microlunatus sp.]
MVNHDPWEIIINTADTASGQDQDQRSGRIVPRAPARRFGQFALLCLALSWLPWTILGVAGADIDSGPGFVVFGLAASGPSLAALVLWLCLPGERRPHSRPSWYGPLAAIFLGAAAPVITALLLQHGNPGAITDHLVAVAVGVGGPLGVIGYTLISGPLSEEFGWRGYLQPRLRQRFGRARTAVVLGLGWGLWHVPLFLLPGTGQHQLGLFTIGGASFFLTIIAFSYLIILITEDLRGGVWAAVAAHAGFNAADALMPPHGDLGAVIELVAMIILAGVVGAMCAVRRRRVSDRQR